MENNIFAALAIAIAVSIFLGAISYNGYLAWFKPSKFKDSQVNRVKNWWPYSKYYRSYLNSPGYLWWIRITSIIILLITVCFFVLTVLGVLGFIPK